MISLRFFASLCEKVGSPGEQFELNGIAGVIELRQALAARGGRWLALTEDHSLLVAINQEIVETDAPLKDGDEVAFFPPVTGG